MEPQAFGMGIRRNGNVTSVGAPCPCDGVDLKDKGGVEHQGGKVEPIHREFREKEHKGLRMQEGWKHYALGVREGGSTAHRGCREDGMKARRMQRLGLMQEHSGQGMFSAWHRRLAAAGPGYQRGDSHRQGIPQGPGDSWDMGSVARWRQHSPSQPCETPESAP